MSRSGQATQYKAVGYIAMVPCKWGMGVADMMLHLPVIGLANQLNIETDKCTLLTKQRDVSPWKLCVT